MMHRVPLDMEFVLGYIECLNLFVMSMDLIIHYSGATVTFLSMHGLFLNLEGILTFVGYLQIYIFSVKLGNLVE